MAIKVDISKMILLRLLRPLQTLQTNLLTLNMKEVWEAKGTYAKLSKEAGVEAECADSCDQLAQRTKNGNKAWEFVSKVLLRIVDGKDSELRKGHATTDQKGDGGSNETAAEGKKKSSSWLPNPDQRWPVQGW
uniref:Uncharacterized protein n=1 Tax=Kalanchoe fedtschenkoi TaxID=63787 RepID=A0A7N0UDC3_KALFE